MYEIAFNVISLCLHDDAKLEEFKSKVESMMKQEIEDVILD